MTCPVGTTNDVEALTRALNDPEALMWSHVIWVLGRLESRATGR